MNEMLVKKSINIGASPETVWEILTRTVYIRQWDDLPEDYVHDSLTLNQEITWKMESNDFTRLTVIKFDPPTELQLALFLSTWKNAPAPGEVSYHYEISDLQGHTMLSMSIGDFSKLENGENYYKESIRFADQSSEMIKSLAEKKII